MKIEAGKYYRTRDGRKVGPMVEWSENNAPHPFEVTNEPDDYDLRTGLWSTEGECDEGNQADLIAEWQDESTTAGTLAELDVKAGDVVEFLSGRGGSIKVGTHLTVDMDGCAKGEGYDLFDPEFDETYNRKFRIISRAKPTPTPFGEMTDAEQAALLLAHHRGERIEYYAGRGWVAEEPEWHGLLAYRIAPEEPNPVVETVEMYAKTNKHGNWIGSESASTMTHRITFNTVDGVPDCGSVKMVPVT